MFNRSATRLAAAALAVALVASAAAFGAGTAAYPQVALTDTIIKQFVASYPAVKATADKNITLNDAAAIRPAGGARGWQRHRPGAKWMPW